MKNLKNTDFNYNNVLKCVGDQCKQGRLSANISLEEIAYELGYAKETVYAFESGRNNNLYIYLFYKYKGLI